MKNIRFEYRITFIYLIIGLLWIFFSDTILQSSLSGDQNVLTFFQSVKGSFFVVITAILLFFLVQNHTSRERKIRQTLKESEAHYRSLFYDNKSVMLLIDGDSADIVDANAAALQYYGYSLAEITSMKISDINTLSREKVREEMRAAMKQERNFFRFKHRLKNGEVRNVEVYSGSVKVKNKSLLYSIVHDINRQVKAEEELIMAKQKAEESDRLKSAFLANLSHEIRTPMNGILGFTDLLRDYKLSEERKRQYIDTVHSSGRYLLGIIDDIVEMSKLNTAQVSVNKEKMSLYKLCSSVMEKCMPLLPEDRNIKMVSDFVKADDLCVIADKNKVKQVVVNFINNAIKYTLEGEIHSGCLLTSDRRLMFYVKDTGIGVDEKYHQEIFQPFFQVDTGDEVFQEGSGLGLSIAKSYVQLMDGEIWLESEPGKGSVFYFTIPYVPAIEEGRDQKATPTSKPVSVSKKVIVAEDDDINYEYIKEVLELLDVDIVRARNGLEAIEACRNNLEADLVLMDIKMPKMNGFDALKQIKAEFPQMPVVAQTAYALSADRNQIHSAGFDGYISKPIKKESLLEYIS